MAESMFGPDDEIDDEFKAEAKKKFLELCDEKRAELSREDPDGARAFRFKKLNFSYETVQQNGGSIWLSAFMGFAIHINDNPYDQNHILFCCPYTHTYGVECATRDGGGWEFKTMLSDNLFIMPDGQGFGDDALSVQTYLNHELHAQQYYDAFRAGYDIYIEDEHGTLEDDWTLRVVGASQGAGDAIALHKFLDKNYKRLDLTNYYNEGRRAAADAACRMFGYPKGTKYIEVPLCNIHRFEYSYVCSGPYCPEATMQTYSRWTKMSYPCVIPLVIKSMISCYPELLKYGGEEAFFSKEWNDNKADFDKLYREKTMESKKLNRYICLKLGVDEGVPMLPLDKMLSQEMMDTNSPIYRDLIECLKKQDLTTDWRPRTRTYLDYTKNDEVVPCENTERLVALFKANNVQCTTADYSYGGILNVGHVSCCTGYITSSWDR